MKFFREQYAKFQAWGHYSPILVPSVLIGIIFVAIIVSFILLIRSITLQLETGTSLLSYNLSDQTRVFVQLQRETLRMQVIVHQPAEEFDAEAAQLQYDLLASRVFHLNRAEVLDIVPEDIGVSAQLLIDDWEGLSPEIAAWIAEPNNADLRASLIESLVAYENLANATEIDFNRVRTLTLSEFAEVSRQIPFSFGIAVTALLILAGLIVFILFRYLREVQEAEAARQASGLKDQFLAVMSHELRTPLNAIIGFLGIMKMSNAVNEKGIHMVDRSRANAERLLALIDDILDISKIEAGRFEINPEALAINDLVNRWKSQTEVLAAQKGLNFNVVLDTNFPPQIYADADALTKIVTNLLSNAFKFTSKGQVSLVILASEKSWTIRVSDTGIGIPEEQQGAIFESFRQVDSSIRRQYGGTGLGLAIVKYLVGLMSGQIILESHMGEGSSFTITLPLVLVPAETMLEKAV
jgi:signal transduction histidine kinase